MAERDDRVYLADMLDAIRRARRFVSGMDLDRFLDDEKTQSAVMREVAVVGEAARHVSDGFRQKHADRHVRQKGLWLKK